ncbi:hypothetical protein ACIBCM_14015 [Streptomyces sp. NPDC051018]|uniref:hypothetical protein n=1 Tax=Streptomyces sp. NPDC051018 TaxID=3365639 RepID=UPI0037AF56FF
MTRSARRLPYALVRTAAVFVLSAGVAVPAVVMAPNAFAATAVSFVTTNDRGQLVVGLPDNTYWVKVDVLASGEPGAAVLASTDRMVRVGYSNPSNPAGWATETPIRLPEGTPYGDYPVSISYHVPNEAAQERKFGTFAYKLHTGVSSLAYDRESTDFDNRAVVASGKVTTFDPATGISGPARAGTEVKLTLTLNGRKYPRPKVETAVTGANGTFSLPVTPDAEIQYSKAEVVKSADTEPKHEVPFPTSVGVKPTTVRIAADTDRLRVHKGAPFTVTGKVERLTNDGWRPFAGAPVVSSMKSPVHWDYFGESPVGTGTSAADGTFAYTARATVPGTVHTSVEQSDYVTKAHDTAAIAVPAAFSYVNVKYSLDEFGRISTTGQAKGAECAGEKFHLQYSADGVKWKSMVVGSANYAGSGTCSFSLAAQGYVAAYYRIYHPESNGLVQLASKASFQYRYVTRFSSATYSSTRPRVNSTITASGALQRYVNGKWRAFPNPKLMVLFKPKGDPQWYWVAKGRANSNGVYSIKAKVYGDGHWAMVIEPTPGHFYTETKATYIDAR